MSTTAPCCRCNKNGRCLNCKCVKRSRPCSTCLPSRLSRCSNVPLLPNSVDGLSTTTAVAPRVLQPIPQPLPTSASSSSTSPIDAPPLTTATESDSAHTIDLETPILSTSRTSPTLISTPSNSSVTTPVSGQSNYTALPPFVQMDEPNFTWRELEGVHFSDIITSTYAEVIHWKHNLFSVPSGKAGTCFVMEISSLFRSYGEGSTMESCALHAAMVLPTLLLQKPHSRSKSREHVRCLDRRLTLWKEGNIEALLHEGRTIQSHFRKVPSQSNAGEKFMKQGKLKTAIRLLSEQSKSGVLSLDNTVQSPPSQPSTVRGVLLEKHPSGQPAFPETLIHPLTPTLEPHPVLFDRLDGEMIRSAVFRTEGGAGPSGVDSHAWKRMCTSFKRASSDLCNSVAMVARRICTVLVDPKGLAPLTASRLIALDKCPGIRPIGIGETVRRIIGKAILYVIGQDIQDAAGSSQLCAGQESGCEAAVHAMCQIFQEKDTEAVLAINAFNCLNRQSTLLNIRTLCPSFANVLINTY